LKNGYGFSNAIYPPNILGRQNSQKLEQNKSQIMFEEGTMERKLYVLTDGDDLYDRREMTPAELLEAEAEAKQKADGELFWMQADDLALEKRLDLVWR